MNLPAIVIAYADRWNALVSGSTSAENGTPRPMKIISASNACHARRDSSAGRGGKPSAKPDRSAGFASAVVLLEAVRASTAAGEEEAADVMLSGLRAAALQGEHALRTLLDKQHDQHEHRDFREHRAPERFDRLADESEAEAAEHRARNLADAT